MTIGSIILMILAAMLIDWILGTVVNYGKNKQLKRDEDLFEFKLNIILDNKLKSVQERVDEAKELCRMTKGKMSAGAYIALDGIYDALKDKK